MQNQTTNSLPVGQRAALDPTNTEHGQAASCAGRPGLDLDLDSLTAAMDRYNTIARERGVEAMYEQIEADLAAAEHLAAAVKAESARVSLHDRIQVALALLASE
jgi:hypothetical protein